MFNTPGNYGHSERNNGLQRFTMKSSKAVMVVTSSVLFWFLWLIVTEVKLLYYHLLSPEICSLAHILPTLLLWMGRAVIYPFSQGDGN